MIIGMTNRGSRDLLAGGTHAKGEPMAPRRPELEAPSLPAWMRQPIPSKTGTEIAHRAGGESRE